VAALHALALRKPRRADMTRPTAAGDEIGAGVGVSSWGAGPSSAPVSFDARSFSSPASRRPAEAMPPLRAARMTSPTHDPARALQSAERGARRRFSVFQEAIATLRLRLSRLPILSSKS
jgi:hypothetical protein